MSVSVIGLAGLSKRSKLFSIESHLNYKIALPKEVRIAHNIITPTAHFLVERRIGSRGKSHPVTLTYQGMGAIGQEVGNSILSIYPQHSVALSELLTRTMALLTK